MTKTFSYDLLEASSVVLQSLRNDYAWFLATDFHPMEYQLQSQYNCNFMHPVNVVTDNVKNTDLFR